MTSQINYPAARERLIGASDDAAVLSAFDRVAEAERQDDEGVKDAALGGFLAETRRLGLSLDWIFFGAGKPHMKGEDA